jgi:ATP-dependent Zn protease
MTPYEQRGAAALAHRQFRPVNEELRVAAHEAGHAITRWAQSLPFTSVTIEGREIDGRTVNGRVTGDKDSVNDDDWFDLIVVSVAGAAAELIYLGQSRGLKGSDKRKAHLFASGLASSDRAIDLLVRAATVEANSILNEHYLALDSLISALCQNRTMSGADVIALIEREATKLSPRSADREVASTP